MLRRAFTLVEIVIAVAVITILGGVVLVTLSSFGERRAVDEAHDVLTDLADRLGTYQAAVTKYPLRLSHLVTLITTSDRNSCGADAAPFTAYRATPDVSGWNTYVTANGLFYTREIPAGIGVPIRIGVIKDQLVRIPTQPVANASMTQAIADTARGRLQIQIDSVLRRQAVDLDRMVDAVADSSLGTVRWSAFTGNPATDAVGALFWTIPVRGC